MKKSVVFLAVLTLISWCAMATIIQDPIGDTFPGSIYTHDLTSFEGAVVQDYLLIKLTFNNTISPTDSGLDSALYGYVDIFTDQSTPPQGDFCGGGSPRAWGANHGVSSPVPTSPFFELAFFPPTEGSQKGFDAGFQALLFDNNDNLVGPQPTIWGSDFVEVRIPLAALNDDGIEYMGTEVGDHDGPTDCAPNQGFLLSDIKASVPTLTELGLLFLITIMSVAGVVFLRRKHS
jgi:hypothetical protein